MMEGYAILSLLLCLSVPSAFSKNVYREGDVRLAGTGSDSRSGRVEVFIGGEWGTVCDDYWGTRDADVVCRQLGYYAGSSGFTTQAGEFGQGSGKIVLDHVSCRGNEDRITDCEVTWNYPTGTGCLHYQDAGVYCKGCDVEADCVNGGTCNMDIRMCDCPPGFFGPGCELGCAMDSECEHGGTCNVDTMTCDCQPGYYGPNCIDEGERRREEDVEFYLKKEEQMAAEEESNNKKEADLKTKDVLQALSDLLAKLNDK